MYSLGLIDSRAISNKNAGSERHVREILKRLSYRYKIYYIPTTHAYLDRPSEEQIKEVKKYAKIPSFFEYLLEKRVTTSITREFFTFSPLARKLLKEYKKEIDEVDFAYTPHNYRIQLMSSLLLSSLGRKYGMLLMTDPHNSLMEKESIFKCINIWTKIWFNRRSAVEFCTAQRVQDAIFLLRTQRRKPSFIAVMNPGAKHYTYLPKFFNVQVLTPPHAFNPVALRYRNFDKDDYIVFLGRINTAKGANEALELSRYIKLKMIGYPEQEVIAKQARSLGVEIIEGVSEEEKFEILSRAKALVLPSHQESFSVAILEALAVGTPVITYDLPSLTSLYGFRPVFFVREFDTASMIKRAKEVIKLNNKDIKEMFSDEKLERFLDLHSSWDNVANAVDSMIKDFI